MFPDVTNSRLEEALITAKGNLDEAIDLVIKQKTADENGMQIFIVFCLCLTYLHLQIIRHCWLLCPYLQFDILQS